MYAFLVAILFGVILAFTTVSTGQIALVDRLTNRSDEVTVDFYAYKKAIHDFACTHAVDGVIPDDELDAQLGKTIGGTQWHHYIAGGRVYFYINDTEKNRQLSAGLTDRTDVMQAVVMDASRNTSLLNGQHADIAIPNAVPGGSIVLPMDISHICVLQTDANDQATLSDGTVIDLCAQKVTAPNGTVVTHYNGTLGVNGITVVSSVELADGTRVTVNGYVFTRDHSIRMTPSGMQIDGIHYDWSNRQGCGGTPSTPATYENTGEVPTGGGNTITDPTYDPTAGDTGLEDPNDTAETNTSETVAVNETHQAVMQYVWGPYDALDDTYQAQVTKAELLGASFPSGNVVLTDITVTLNWPESYQFMVVNTEDAWTGGEQIVIVKTCAQNLTLRGTELTGESITVDVPVCGVITESETDTYLATVQAIASPEVTVTVNVFGTYTTDEGGSDTYLEP
ncbi:MAG: type IV pilus biogenesis protein PilM [Oxalobacter sp.]|nr:type IV pilus biogenesis protein PilM [Oxalobacter sp.]